jgi:hypothetical protein
LLKVFQSDEVRYPFALPDAWEIERTLFEIESGELAEVIRFKYAVFQSVVEAVNGMLYPAVNENTPVPDVYVNPVAVEESDVDEILLLNVVQSVDDR